MLGSLLSTELTEEDFRYFVEAEIESFKFVYSVFHRYVGDPFAFQRYHSAPLLFMGHVGGMHTESGGEHSVECCGRTTSLDMAKSSSAGLESGAGFDKSGKLVADAAQLFVTEIISFDIIVVEAVVGKFGAFRHNHDGIIATPAVALLNRFDNVVYNNRSFRYKNEISTTGDAAITGYPSGVASHHFAYKNAVVGFCRCMQPINRLGHYVDGGVEAEGKIGGAQVIVDGLGDADHIEPVFFVHAVGDTTGIFAAHGNPGPGAAAAVRNLDLVGQVDIMGFDFGLPVLELIENGEIRATVGQNPYLMGYMSMMLAYGARHETDIPQARAGFGPFPTAGIDTGVSILGPDAISVYMNPPQF